MLFWSYLRGENQPPSACVEIVESRLRRMLQPIIRQIQVDEDFYLRQNPDVLEKVKSGELRSGKQHYISAGYFEDRFPRAIHVDEPWYLSEYLDVRQAMSDGGLTSARQHFERDGFKEGRLPKQGWSLIEIEPT